MVAHREVVENCALTQFRCLTSRTNPMDIGVGGVAPGVMCRVGRVSKVRRMHACGG